MANSATLNDCMVLDVITDGSDQETVTVGAGNVTNDYDFFASNAGYSISSIIVTTIATNGAGALLDVYAGSVAAANKICTQVDVSATGTTVCSLAPAGSLTTDNLAITGDLLIVTSGADSRNRVQLFIGSPSAKTVTLS